MPNEQLRKRTFRILAEQILTGDIEVDEAFEPRFVRSAADHAQRELSGKTRESLGRPLHQLDESGQLQQVSGRPTRSVFSEGPMRAGLLSSPLPKRLYEQAAVNALGAVGLSPSLGARVLGGDPAASEAVAQSELARQAEGSYADRLAQGAGSLAGLLPALRAIKGVGRGSPGRGWREPPGSGRRGPWRPRPRSEARPASAPTWRGFRTFTHWAGPSPRGSGKPP